MTLEALNIVICTLQIFGVIMAQAVYMSTTAGAAFGFSSRVVAQPGMGPTGHRIDRTLANPKEGAIMYLPLAATAVARDVSNGWTSSAAPVTVVSRLLCVPIFVFGITKIRTPVRALSLVAAPLMAFGLLVGQAP